MTHFLRKIFLFLLPVFLIWGVVEVFYQIVETNYSYKHHRIKEKYSKIETLILGDSHAFFGINPIYLDGEVFSIANISQSLYFDQLLFEKHVDSLPKLRNLILTIGYYSLSQLDNAKEDRWRKYFYAQQMDLDMNIISPLDITKYSLSLHRRFRKSLELIQRYFQNGTAVRCDTLGWGIYYKGTITNNWQQASIKTAKRHEDGLLDFTHNTKRLQTIIDYCKKINCKVFLIDMPVHQEYINAIDPTKLQKTTMTCKALANNNKNTFYLNLRQHPLLEEDDLYDPDHLNHRGAKKFSDIINRMIKDSYKKE